MTTDRQIDPHARTIVAAHTNLEVVCSTARAALTAWNRACDNSAPFHVERSGRRLRTFVEALHAHDLAARCPHPKAQTWRRRLAQAIDLQTVADPAFVRVARAGAARLAV